MILNELLKNTNYDDTMFSIEAIKYVESTITFKDVKGKNTPFLSCLKREKEIKLTPEEAVRQLFLYKLMHDYNYPTSRIEVELPIHFGREVSAD